MDSDFPLHRWLREHMPGASAAPVRPEIASQNLHYCINRAGKPAGFLKIYRDPTLSGREAAALRFLAGSTSVPAMHDAGVFEGFGWAVFDWRDVRLADGVLRQKLEWLAVELGRIHSVELT